MSQFPKIFIVGSSRSGTTMMGAILRKQSTVFTFKELHFFERYWISSDRESIWAKETAVSVVSNLFNKQRNGFYTNKSDVIYQKEAINLYEACMNDKRTSGTELFSKFLEYETTKSGKKIACDQTPRNVFYIKEILESYENAKIICMVRDPRDVMLSQKGKWKRRLLGGSNTPIVETIRSYFNYHPILIAKLWTAAAKKILKEKCNEKVMLVNFEKIVTEPELEIRKVCEFLGIEYEPEMLMVPQVGSSNSSDNKQKMGLDATKVSGWTRGGLTKSEIYFCQKLCEKEMIAFGYQPENLKIPVWKVLSEYISLPIKASISLMLNIRRVKNLRTAVIKRIQG